MPKDVKVQIECFYIISIALPQVISACVCWKKTAESILQKKYEMGKGYESNNYKFDHCGTSNPYIVMKVACAHER